MPALHRDCAAVADAADALRQCGAECLGSDVVGGDGLGVVGDDGAGETTGVLRSAAVHEVREERRVEAVFLFGGPLVDVGAVGFAATRHGHVEH